MIRRAFLSCATAGLGLAWAGHGRAACAIPAGETLVFDVRRHGGSIGAHALRFERQGDDVMAHIDVHMAISLGPIVLFRYRHQGVEHWHGDEFVSLETQTDNDGQALTVSAKNLGDRVHVEANGLAPQDLPRGSLPLTHWNRRCMTAPLFNPQDGKVMTETVTPLGPDKVTLGNGAVVAATRYAMNGKSVLDDWYDAGGIWAALQARATDGSMVAYKRTS